MTCTTRSYLNEFVDIILEILVSKRPVKITCEHHPTKQREKLHHHMGIKIVDRQTKQAERVSKKEENKGMFMLNVRTKEKTVEVKS